MLFGKSDKLMEKQTFKSSAKRKKIEKLIPVLYRGQLFSFWPIIVLLAYV